MRIFKSLSLISRIAFIILFAPLLFLSLYSYFFYQLLILLLAFFIIYGLVTGIRLGRSRLKKIIVLSILLVPLWAGYCISPEFNFWLTSSTRQSVVNRLMSGRASEATLIENLLLGKATLYRDSHEVYFNYYKSVIETEAAFIIYASNPKTIASRYKQLKQLQHSWFFLLRGYAD